MNTTTSFSNDGLKKPNATNDLRRTIPSENVKTAKGASGTVGTFELSKCCDEPVTYNFCIACLRDQEKVREERENLLMRQMDFEDRILWGKDE